MHSTVKLSPLGPICEFGSVAARGFKAALEAHNRLDYFGHEVAFPAGWAMIPGSASPGAGLLNPACLTTAPVSPFQMPTAAAA